MAHQSHPLAIALPIMGALAVTAIALNARPVPSAEPSLQSRASVERPAEIRSVHRWLEGAHVVESPKAPLWAEEPDVLLVLSVRGDRTISTYHRAGRDLTEEELGRWQVDVQRRVAYAALFEAMSRAQGEDALTLAAFLFLEGWNMSDIERLAEEGRRRGWPTAVRRLP